MARKQKVKQQGPRELIKHVKRGVGTCWQQGAITIGASFPAKAKPISGEKHCNVDDRTARQKAFDAFDAERQYQDITRGPHFHTVGEWILILKRKLEDAEKAWYNGGTDGAALAQLVQVGGVATAVIEQHGVVIEPKHSIRVAMERPDMKHLFGAAASRARFVTGCSNPNDPK